MPDDLTGWSVLDIGAWDGFFSFEAERRGASRVVALDHVIWNDPRSAARGSTWPAGRSARRSRTSTARSTRSPRRRVGGIYDLVLFLGVLYHVHHPLLALERVSSVCDRMLILETHVDLEEHRRPAMAYYPGTECANDLSNWFGPELGVRSRRCSRTVGFRP